MTGIPMWRLLENPMLLPDPVVCCDHTHQDDEGACDE